MEKSFDGKHNFFEGKMIEAKNEKLKMWTKNKVKYGAIWSRILVWRDRIHTSQTRQHGRQFSGVLFILELGGFLVLL